MGKIENNAVKLIKRRRIQDGLLLALYATVGLTLVVTAPGATQLLKYIDPDIKKKRDPAQRINQAIKRLFDNKLIVRTKLDDGKTQLKLTKAGEERARHLYAYGYASVEKPKRWDGRFRIVIFDIWEKRKSARNSFRKILQRVGFVKVQNSVWAYPYDCEEILTLIKTDLKLGKGVLYFVAEGVENDAVLRKHFNLPAK